MQPSPEAGRRAAWMLCLLVMFVCCVGGCSAMATGLWLFQPNDAAAEYDGLEEKRVAVVCRTVQSLGYKNASVPPMIARRVGKLLGENVKKVEVISQKEINDWNDSNEWTSPDELGKALQADVVVVIDLERFSLYRGQTLYQGQADVHLIVHDVIEGESEELTPVESLYPPKNAVPVDVSETRFRRKYVEVLADQLARRFYNHDSRTAFATDAFYED